jgi:putative spermidine/putrescine transport system ATP-binding protein
VLANGGRRTPSAGSYKQRGQRMIAAVSFENVSRHFGSVKAVDSVDLEVQPGEFFAMLGPSGSGKTTCLRLIAGFEHPTAGAISIFGERAEGVPPYRRNVNTVFQDYALFPHMNVLDNVAYGLKVKGVSKTERIRTAEDALALVRLPGYGTRKPGQLSGGQRQRVALARALVNRPKVLLLDEPLGALDLKLRENMQEELKALQKSLGITFIFVTHDQGEALSMADRVAVFNDGRIMQVGTPQDIYARPASRFVADFVGSSNVVPPDFVKRHCRRDGWGSLRPEAIRVSTETNSTGIPARVVSVSYVGAATRLGLDAEGLRLHATIPVGVTVPEQGADVVLSFGANALHVMEADA